MTGRLLWGGGQMVGLQTGAQPEVTEAKKPRIQAARPYAGPPAPLPLHTLLRGLVARHGSHAATCLGVVQDFTSALS